MNDSAQNLNVSVLIIDHKQCLLADSIQEDWAITIAALASEDPEDWAAATRVWPRYRTPAVCQDSSEIPFEVVDLADAIETLRGAPAWVAIDLTSKRLFYTGDIIPLEPDSFINTNPDEESDDEWLLVIHLPPWWELHADAYVGAILQPRESKIPKRVINRNVLYGTPLWLDLATRLIDADEQQDWMSYTAKSFTEKQHQLTIEIHRDWLMAPREDLGGRMPRELLHGSISWLDKVIEGQGHRFDRGAPLTGLPKDWDPANTGPVGRSEMCMYFALCRTLVTTGWAVLNEKREDWASRNRDEKIALLTTDLANIQSGWMNSNYDDDVAPKIVIEYEQRRVPRGQGLTVDGFDKPGAIHETNCDCPICEMMNDGLFGTGFISYDGYNLEMDNEFAFSMYETREEWERGHMAYEDDFGMSDDWLGDDSDDGLEDEADEGLDDDDLKPVWTGIQPRDELPGGQLPGDSSGQLLMAFMLSELTGNLQGNNASQLEIDLLNQAFKAMRKSSGQDRSQLAASFKNKLEELTVKYPALTPKIADLQSMIDESGRNL
ncbi:MAG: hypothetical protein MUC43_14635 [Pirellula sp.]|jgi:hypothetical protein|nr:hypothetical protein [Pirellula sp.]